MSDKVKMSVTCVKCGKHAVDWRDTLEQEHWAQLDERPLCPDCANKAGVKHLRESRQAEWQKGEKDPRTWWVLPTEDKEQTE